MNDTNRSDAEFLLNKAVLLDLKFLRVVPLDP